MNQQNPVPDATDALEHLWTAAHEMLRAIRTLVDAADEFVESQLQRPHDADRDPHLHRIDIDAP